jgi:hypothetical protein
MNVKRLEGEYMLTIILQKRPALNNIFKFNDEIV